MSRLGEAVTPTTLLFLAQKKGSKGSMSLSVDKWLESTYHILESLSTSIYIERVCGGVWPCQLEITHNLTHTSSTVGKLGFFIYVRGCRISIQLSVLFLTNFEPLTHPG